MRQNPAGSIVDIIKQVKCNTVAKIMALSLEIVEIWVKVSLTIKWKLPTQPGVGIKTLSDPTRNVVNIIFKLIKLNKCKLLKTQR